MTEARELDIVLFGATGFTGVLTAEYLAAAAPAGARWAIAGRSRSRLDALRDRLGVDVTAIVADADDPAALRRLAQSTHVVATTVGPFIRYGEPLVAACAAAGTDYADLTGEPEFVDLMYLRHHATAERTGARLVHACGFDSVPHDLGVQFTVAQLPADRPIRLRGYVRAGGYFSGGTLDSALTAMARRRSTAAAYRKRSTVEGHGPRRAARVVGGRPGYDRSAGYWVLPLPTIDPQIVVRSAAALGYGPDFRYTHYAAFRSPVSAAGIALGVGAAAALARLPPTRALLRRLRPPGAGPDAERRARSWFRIRFAGGTPDDARLPDGRVVTEVSGGDPGYGETAKMLAESALCLAFDDTPATCGQVTTAVAMGEALRDRLIRAGIRFTVQTP